MIPYIRQGGVPLKPLQGKASLIGDLRYLIYEGFILGVRWKGLEYRDWLGGDIVEVTWIHRCMQCSTSTSSAYGPPRIKAVQHDAPMWPHDTLRFASSWR